MITLKNRLEKWILLYSNIHQQHQWRYSPSDDEVHKITSRNQYWYFAFITAHITISINTASKEAEKITTDDIIQIAKNQTYIFKYYSNFGFITEQTPIPTILKAYIKELDHYKQLLLSNYKEYMTYISLIPLFNRRKN